MRNIMMIAAVALCAACQTAAQAPAPAYRLIDLTDEFAAFYDRSEGLPIAERVAAFKGEIVPLFPEFYGRERFQQLSDERYDARIARAITQFPEIRESYQAKSAAFEALLGPALASFTEHFPDMGEVGEIHLLHSLGEMDGGTRNFGGRRYLIFGADVMARVHPYEDEEPFFHHELFHIYHQVSSFDDCGAVWCALWIEGLATHVAQSLNPDASPDQLLLTVPESIPPAVDANFAEAICEVSARLDSRDPADLQALFSFQRLNERLPPRFGYYVGALVAREAGRNRSLIDLARLSQQEARPVVEESLAALASCG